MTPSQEHEIVLHLLQTASAGQPIPAEGHVVDDEELLACWEAGLVTPGQRGEILAHLAACPRCRNRLAEMARRGQIEWAEPESQSRPSPAVAPRRTPASWVRLAVAASILVAVGLIGLMAWRPGASRGIPSGSALALRGKVTDYGYLLDGQSATKGFMTFDPELERQRKTLEEAVRQRPEDAAAWTAYGELLLRMDKPRQAAAAFEEVLKLNPGDPAGRLGLGLAKFLEGRLPEALAEFEAVLQADPTETAAKLDAAACLARLGRPDEAEQYWCDVLAHTQDAKLRRQIEDTIRLTREQLER